MIQGNPRHTGSIDIGPVAPLRQSWRAKSDDKTDDFTFWPIVQSGTVVVGSGSGVLAVDADTGRRRWFVSPPSGQAIVGAAADSQRVFMPLPDFGMAAYSLPTGQEVWRLRTDGAVSSSPALKDGQLYFGSSEARTFYCVSVDGRFIWKLQTDFSPDSVPAAADGVVVFSTEDFSSDRVTLIAASETKGEILWTSDLIEGNSSPSITEDGLVVFGGGDFFAYALDLKTGKQVWRSPMKGKFGIRNSPALAFGDVFLADRIGNIYRLDGKTGKRKWIFTNTVGTFDQSFPVVAGKTLFIGNGSGNIYAVDVDSGRLLWKKQVEGFVLSGAADDKHFYFGVKFRNEGLYAYEHDPNGKLIGSDDRDNEPPNKLAGGIILLVLAIAISLAGIAFFRRRRSH